MPSTMKVRLLPDVDLEDVRDTIAEARTLVQKMPTLIQRDWTGTTMLEGSLPGGDGPITM